MLSSWLAPRCPVSLADKVWIELRLRWLAEQFGLASLQRAEVILPTTEYFPREFHGTRKELELLYDNCCDWMGVPRGSVDLEIASDTELQDGVAHYDYSREPRRRRARHSSAVVVVARGKDAQPVIRVQQSLLSFPPQLAKALVHELAHDRLLRPHLLSEQDEDHEQVTDLLPVFFGLGVIQANGVIHESVERAGRSLFYNAFAVGYLNAFQLGYALALFAWLREEANPAWAKELRLDASATFWAGMKYLRKTGQSHFRLDDFHKPSEPQTERQWIERLGDSDPEVRWATIWQLGRCDQTSPKIIDAVIDRLGDKEQTIPARAMKILQRGDLAPRAIAPLLALLHSRRGEDVCAALNTLSEWQAAPEEVLRSAVPLLRDEREQVAQAAAEAIGCYPAAAERFAKPLVEAFVDAVVHCATNEFHLAWVLCQIATQPETLIEKYASYAMTDAELRPSLVRVLNEARTAIQAANKYAQPSVSTTH